MVYARLDLGNGRHVTNLEPGRGSVEHKMAFSDSASSTSGYDCDAAAPLPPRSVVCPICLKHLRNPHIVSCCGKEFCESCIQRVKRDHQPFPMCRELNFTTFLHKGLTREVNSRIIYCKYKEKGCDWTGERRHLKAHLNQERIQSASASTACKYMH